VCGIDQYNCHVLQKFFIKYGDQPIRRESGATTTIKRELSQLAADLLNMAYESQILQ
jgi:hypothetical protein